MSRKKRKLSLINPEHVSSCYALLGELKQICESNQVACWRAMISDRSAGVTGQYKYWKNAASAFKWAQGLLLQAYPDASTNDSNASAI